MHRRIILAQLEGSGRGALGSYNKAAYEDLQQFIQDHPLKDGDEWLQLLLRRNSMLGKGGASQLNCSLMNVSRIVQACAF